MQLESEYKEESRSSSCYGILLLEVPGGFEPPCTVLQTGD